MLACIHTYIPTYLHTYIHIYTDRHACVCGDPDKPANFKPRRHEEDTAQPQHGQVAGSHGTGLGCITRQEPESSKYIHTTQYIELCIYIYMCIYIYIYMKKYIYMYIYMETVVHIVFAGEGGGRGLRGL